MPVRIVAASATVRSSSTGWAVTPAQRPKRKSTTASTAVTVSGTIPRGTPEAVSCAPWPTSHTSAPTRSASVVCPWAPASARNQPMTASPMKVTIVVPAAPTAAIAAVTVSGRPSGSPAVGGPDRRRNSSAGSRPDNRPRERSDGLVADGRFSRSVIAVPSCPRRETSLVRHAG